MSDVLKMRKMVPTFKARKRERKMKRGAALGLFVLPFRAVRKSKALKWYTENLKKKSAAPRSATPVVRF